MRLTVFLLFALLFNTPGFAQNCKGCGVAFQGVRLFKPERNVYMLPAYERDTKYLFVDSMMILERHGLFIETDSKGKETWRVDVIGYTFVDFRTQTFYDYRHLSDTARIIQATSHPKGWPKGGGWMFFQKNPRQYKTPVPLSDTMLDGVKYSRIKGFFIKNGDTSLIETMYYMTETERPLAYFGKVAVNGKQFSFTRLDDSDIASGLKTYSFMDVVSHDLSKKELKVFAAWKKNAAKIDRKKMVKKRSTKSN